jgi:trigger factor
MNISKRENGDLSAIISIEVQPSDYQPKVDEAIKNFRKNASIPGFRPGHVPAGLIKKKYGKEVLAEELNRLLGNELYNYLRENKIDVLGTPLPITNQEEQELEEGRNFKFDYEVGLAPEVKVQMPANKVPYYLIKVDDQMIENDINDMRRRYGKFSNPEAADANSILYGEFTELDETGEPKEAGVSTTTTLAIDMIRDEVEKSKFLGAQKDKEIVFSPRIAIKNDTEVAAMLRIGADSASMDSEYRFTVKTVNEIQKAEINQELFDKTFGEGVVSDEESFRAKIREGIAAYFEQQSDKKLKKDLRNILLSENNISLPDDFLKRMLKSQQKETMDDHAFEHEYYHVAEDLKWNLIESKIAAEANIEVKFEDVMDASKLMIAQQFAQYGVPAPEEAKLQEMARDYLLKDDNHERVQRSLVGQRVFEHLKKTLKLNMIEQPYDEYVATLNERSAHEVEHNH